MPVTTGRSEQVAIRLPHDHIARAKAVAEALSRPGLDPMSMAEAMRGIVLRGLEAWEKELGIEGAKPAKKRAKR